MDDVLNYYNQKKFKSIDVIFPKKFTENVSKSSEIVRSLFKNNEIKCLLSFLESVFIHSKFTKDNIHMPFCIVYLLSLIKDGKNEERIRDFLFSTVIECYKAKNNYVKFDDIVSILIKYGMFSLAELFIVKVKSLRTTQFEIAEVGLIRLHVIKKRYKEAYRLIQKIPSRQHKYKLLPEIGTILELDSKTIREHGINTNDLLDIIVDISEKYLDSHFNEYYFFDFLFKLKHINDARLLSSTNKYIIRQNILKQIPKIKKYTFYDMKSDGEKAIELICEGDWDVKEFYKEIGYHCDINEFYIGAFYVYFVAKDYERAAQFLEKIPGDVEKIFHRISQNKEDFHQIFLILVQQGKLFDTASDGNNNCFDSIAQFLNESFLERLDDESLYLLFKFLVDNDRWLKLKPDVRDGFIGHIIAKLLKCYQLDLIIQHLIKSKTLKVKVLGELFRRKAEDVFLRKRKLLKENEEYRKQLNDME